MAYDFNDDLDDPFYNDQLDYTDTEPRDTISIHQPEQLMEDYRKLLTKYNKFQAAYSELILSHERLIALVS
jgi:hypothetical protein